MDSTLKQLTGIEAMDETSCVTIGVASPETIRSWSHGEVKNPETINYRSFKPEKGGLFCERIFGPTHDWECNCGKYKRVKHKGVVCDRCGVEVTLSRVRRERMGHLELAVPVSHVWFYKCMPSRLGLMLDMTPRALEKVLYYESWIVTDKGNTPLEDQMLLSEEEYRESREAYGDSFKAGMGAEAIEELLAKLDLEAIRVELSEELVTTKSKAVRKKIAKRVRLVEGFIDNKMNPCWMVLHVLPVIPPELRPLVPLEGGRFATSDLNDLYRRVINRNNRLRNLLQLKTPEVIIRNEKRMLQEAVDALLDNGRHGRAVTGTGNRPLKSLTGMLKGKQGRFRQNLLGKRVDYSGRSVIVVGPELRINQCGLPKEMALVLFEPFIMRRLKERGHVHTVRNAKKWIEQRRKEVWDILDEVIKGHPILLNRAPTLHRLSIQAFDPILIEGQAIRLHPLVCTAFNADFDGDQMAVHVPLSNEAQLEAKLIMLAPNNIFSPASGKPITTPSQDITLGVYYLCYENKRDKEAFLKTPAKEQRWFNDYHELLRAYDAKALGIHDHINMRNPFYGKDTTWGAAVKNERFIVTTVGRCIFNEIWPEVMGFFNGPVGKKELGRMIKDCYETVGRKGLITVLDRLKDLGYEYATWSGFSIGIQDMIVPKEKPEIIGKAQGEIDKIREQRRIGAITELERYNKSIDVWTQANNELAARLFKVLEENNGSEEINPVFAMLDSGARGSKDQVRQLAGMRGLMAKPSGEIIERPIQANFREGLPVLEYFISSHGARKGLADTALKTADSGYMTRRLVDVAHDVICVEHDCGTVNGIWARPIREGNEDRVPLEDRIIGRFSVDEIKDPVSRTVLVGAGEEITASIAKRIVQMGIEKVHIRSVLTCESDRGVCCKCYGRNLATGDLPNMGDPLGIIAAQSIGEPGTQLTMRTFHYGGTASASFNQFFYEAQHSGILRFQEAHPVQTKDGNYIVLNKNGRIIIENKDGIEQESYELVPGATLRKNDGDSVEIGERFVEWDPYNVPIITKIGGRIEYRDLTEGITMRREISGTSGKEETIVMEHSDDVHPTLVIVGEGAKSGDESAVIDSYSLPAGAHIMVAEKARVDAGEVLAKTPRQSMRTKDITGGLPRVAELFEARRPKEAAEIAKIDGTVELDKPVKGRRNIRIRDLESGSSQDHLIPPGKRIIVFNGDFVRKGSPLTDGTVVLHEMLDICGPQELQEYLVNEVQQVYRLQGVEINDKHIEIIVRQMMRKVRITDPGQTRFLFGESVDKREFQEENRRVLEEGGIQAEAQQMLLGITKASLATESFISAASFQDTTRVLTEAATLGRVDHLRGFKENVIMGHLIPAGTGYHTVQNVKLSFNVPEDEDEEGVISEASEKEAKAKENLAGLRGFLDL
ncbi:DNA-directed RNA polymerase subunit beta' [Oligosphaera ethanolica]|uniref:DNA-directed RNA polymerase subunit beta' n=2 Tax=Oligosphaera ethanolica TaxID=760260 RepID=A0AAE4AND7_9BACT|nr:DNA-directed RNA polymerase subunit beta' [Oligosphaera ethanolica]MDQ0288823.1 DNA-directed RNA polymerase subunit beta' [Oligosphaera ethanolica]